MLWVVVTKTQDKRDYKVFARNTDAITYRTMALSLLGLNFLEEWSEVEIIRVNTNDRLEATALVQAGKGEPYKMPFEINMEDIRATLADQKYPE